MISGIFETQVWTRTLTWFLRKCCTFIKNITQSPNKVNQYFIKILMLSCTSVNNKPLLCVCVRAATLYKCTAH